MTLDATELTLDESAKRALAQVYALLIQLAEEETADGDGLDSEPQSAANDAPTVRPGVQQGV